MNCMKRYVTTLFSNSFCAFGCSGISRGLCCTTSIARQLAAECTSAENPQIIVVHNDVKYGGIGGSIATTSVHEASPKIAVHELGHSMFSLGDEYTYGSAGDNWRNCDNSGCNSWKDMLGMTFFPLFLIKVCNDKW